MAGNRFVKEALRPISADHIQTINNHPTRLPPESWGFLLQASIKAGAVTTNFAGLSPGKCHNKLIVDMSACFRYNPTVKSPCAPGSEHMQPKVSIIIPTYNRAHYLPEALDSALSQTYPNTEIIVVNDGSTDDTEAVLVPYRKHIRYIKQVNAGCAGAKNTGIKAATGEFLTNLDDDDSIRPEKIALQVDHFLQNPRLGLCGTGVRFVDGDGNLTREYMPPAFKRDIQVLQLLRRCLLVQSSVLIRRECHDRFGGYKLMYGEDYDFWLRVAPHYEIEIVKEYLTDYRCHGDQITGPAKRVELMADMKTLIRDFVDQEPMEHIIPGIQSYPDAYALIGILMIEQQLPDLADEYLRRARPNPSAHLGLALLGLDRRSPDEMSEHLENLGLLDSPLAGHIDSAHQLMKRVQTITQTPGLHNSSPEVVALRRDLSGFRARIIRELLHMARGDILAA